MKELDFTMQDILQIIDTFSKSGIGSLNIRQGEFSLKLESQKTEQILIQGTAAGAVSGTETPSAAAQSPAPPSSGNTVTSPIVGTFYAAAAPDKAPFVQTGSRVQKGDVLFIIESMKLMNEVVSEFDGIVGEIHVENGQGVEYGQPIVTIV